MGTFLPIFGYFCLPLGGARLRSKQQKSLDGRNGKPETGCATVWPTTSEIQRCPFLSTMTFLLFAAKTGQQPTIKQPTVGENVTPIL